MSSQARNPRQWVEPLRYTGDASAAWRVALLGVSHLPRTRLVDSADGRLVAESRSLLGTVSELELIIDAAEHVIHVRSASRMGWWDFGSNRRRVEELRRTFNAHYAAPGTPGSKIRTQQS